MRILHLEDEPWDSGIAHYALTLAAGLKTRGHEVLFWGAAGSPLCDQARREGLAVSEIRRPWLALGRLRAELRRLGVELVNAHTGASHSLAAALLAGSRVPLVRTRGDARPPASHALARALCRRTSAYVAATRRIASEIKAALPAARVEVVYQGIAAPPAAALPGGPLVGLLGRLDPVKGHEDFLDAASSVRTVAPEARFLAAGGGRPERMVLLRERASRLGLDGSAELLGRVPDAMAFIARCRVGVVASTGSEAVSRAALEWMSQGRPVVATKVGCLPELLDDGTCGVLVCPNSPGELAAAILHLLRNPDQAVELGNRARRRFDDLFGYEGFVSATERLYGELRGA